MTEPSGQPAPGLLHVSVRPSVAELLAEAGLREPWKTADSLSGSRFERVTIGGEPFVVKYVCVDDDWILRATGDLNCRQLELFGSALLHRLPEEIDHAVVACAPFTSLRGHRGAALLIREVGSWLVPPGSAAIPVEAHRLFIAHMARMHATYWGFRDDLGLFPLAHHYVFLTPTMAQLELAGGGKDPVPPAVAAGWREMAATQPTEARLLGGLAEDPSPLLAVLGRGPNTLIHGDWKLGNLGRHPDGRTILLDWDRCGAGPPLVDLAWYLAVNCDRLPESKEATIARYRAGLEGCSISTSDWWDEQLAAALLGAFLQLGWSKTADKSEFEWWAERAAESGWLR